MFLFQLISVSLISITFYTYLASIVFSCNLAFNSLCMKEYKWQQCCHVLCYCCVVEWTSVWQLLGG